MSSNTLIHISVLQSAIKASTNKSKKDKKKSKKGFDALDDAESKSPPPEKELKGEINAAEGDIGAPKNAVQMTAEELADEEWGPAKEKGKKKKGKKSKGKTEDENEVTQENAIKNEEPAIEPDVLQEVKPVDVAADDLVDEEWGPLKQKGGKKKNNKSKDKSDEEEQNEALGT